MSWETSNSDSLAHRMCSEKQPIELIPTSQIFRVMLKGAPHDHVTLGWLLDNLVRRSFGMIMLLLGLVAMIPGVCVLAGCMLGILGFQMMMAYDTPLPPRFVAQHPLPARRITGLLNQVVPIIAALEKFIRPRWRTSFVATKRLVGLIVVLLAVTVLMPIPLSNIIPGWLTMLVAFAYLEEDGFFLCVALIASIGSLAIAGIAGWAAISGADFLFRMR